MDIQIQPDRPMPLCCGVQGLPRTARPCPGGTVVHALNRGNGRGMIFHKDVKLLAEAKRRVPGVHLLGYCLLGNHATGTRLGPGGRGGPRRWERAVDGFACWPGVGVGAVSRD